MAAGNAGSGWRRRRRGALRLLMRVGSVLLTRFPFWHCLSSLLLNAERAEARRKPDIQVPFLYFDMGAAVLCASFMSFGVKRRWFALGAALQLAISTYAAYIGGYAHYGDWLKVRMYSRTIAIIGGLLVLASGAGEIYRQKPRNRSLQSTGQVFIGIYLICVVCYVKTPKWSLLVFPPTKSAATGVLKNSTESGCGHAGLIGRPEINWMKHSKKPAQACKENTLLKEEELVALWIFWISSSRSPSQHSKGLW